MIQNKLDLKVYLNIEKKNYNVSVLQRFLALFGYSEKAIIWKYQKSLRKWEYHLNLKHKFRSIFYRLKTTKLGYKYGLNISPNVFDQGLFIKHLGSILVNGKTKVGKNCVVHINTSFVATSSKEAAPTLGDNCYIGVGAILIGGITLGDGVVIGAGSLVTHDVPAHCVAVGNPAKVIKENVNWIK